MNLSDLVPSTNSIGFLAGETVAANDLISFERYTKKGWKVSDTILAATGTMTTGTAQTDAASGRILAQTSLSTLQTPAYARQALVKDTEGNIFTLTSRSTGGVTLTKTSTNGDVLFIAAVDGTAAVSYNHHLLLLDNGSLACIWAADTTLQFSIVNTTTGVYVKAKTTIDTLQAPYFAAVKLSAAGFGVLYQPAGAPLTSVYASYSNTGTVAQAATTVWTRTGTSGNQYHKMIQISNGNIAAAITSNNTVSDIGLFVGVFSTAAVSVSAFTNFNTTNVAQYPEIDMLTGYFAVSYLDGTNHSLYVFNDAKTQQGSTQAYAVTSTGSGKWKLLNDGTDFVNLIPLTTLVLIQKITIGGLLRSEQGTNLGSSLQNFFIDGFYEKGLLFYAAMSGTTAASPVFFIVDAATSRGLSASLTSFGTAPATTNGSYIRVIPGGDFTFIASYDYANVAATNLCIGKYSNTSIIGPAQTAISANATGYSYAEKGSYRINKITGQNGKSFDHSTNLIAGNKGVLTTYGIKIKD